MNSKFIEMKYLIISDIHGAVTPLKQALSYFELWNCDYLIILGDILYHGPRNDLPESYAPKEIIPLLNDLNDRIIAVRGNCEAEVDQVVLDFPCLGEYSMIIDSDKKLFLTHGHHYNPNHLPSLGGLDVLMYGHTHLYQLEKKESIVYFNPGSISIPKGGNEATFGLWNNGELSLHALHDGSILKHLLI